MADWQALSIVAHVMDRGPKVFIERADRRGRMSIEMGDGEPIRPRHNEDTAGARWLRKESASRQQVQNSAALYINAVPYSRSVMSPSLCGEPHNTS